MKRRACLKAIGAGALGAATLSFSRLALAQQDRYSKYRGSTVVVNFPAHPHYDAAIKLLPEFTRETGIKVEVDKMQYVRMHDKQLLEMSKAQGDYDLISYVVMWKTEYVKKGLLEPLEGYLANAALADPAYDLDDIVKGYLENIGLVGGRKSYLPGPGARLYGIPFGAETSIFAYRKDIFDKHGLTPPASYDDLHRLMAVIRDKEPGMGALTSRGQAGHQVVHAWLLHLNPFGGEVFDDAWNPVFQHEPGLKALKFLKDVVDTGPAGIPGYGFGEMMNAFLQGQAAMYLDSIAVLGQVDDPAKSRIAGKVAYALHPKGARYASQTGGFGLAIPKNARNKEAGFLLLEWLTAKAQDVKIARLGGNASRISTFDDPGLRKAYPAYGVLKEQLRHAAPDWRPIIPEWGELNEQVFGVHLSEALTGKRTPEEALAQCVPKAAAIMHKAGYIKG